jgi:hypothetical protein
MTISISNVKILWNVNKWINEWISCTVPQALPVSKLISKSRTGDRTRHHNLTKKKDEVSWIKKVGDEQKTRKQRYYVIFEILLAVTMKSIIFSARQIYTRPHGVTSQMMAIHHFKRVSLGHSTIKQQRANLDIFHYPYAKVCVCA